MCGNKPNRTRVHMEDGGVCRGVTNTRDNSDAGTLEVVGPQARRCCKEGLKVIGGRAVGV